MSSPTEAHLDALAKALIPTLTRVSEYGWTLPPPAPRRHPDGMTGRLACRVCGDPLRDHQLWEHAV